VKFEVRRENFGGAFTVCALVDGSERSHRAFLAAASILNPTTDRIVVVHACHPSEPSTVLPRYEALINEMGLNGTTREFHYEGLNTEESILTFINGFETPFHFIAMGVDGVNASEYATEPHTYGKVTEQIVKFARCNILLSK
jgi:hypothetical protein